MKGVPPLSIRLKRETMSKALARSLISGAFEAFAAIWQLTNYTERGIIAEDIDVPQRKEYVPSRAFHRQGLSGQGILRCH